MGVDIDNKVLFVGVLPAVNSSTCNNLSELKWNLADEGVREIRAIVLLAQEAGKNIKVGVRDGKACIKGQPTGWWVRVEN